MTLISQAEYARRRGCSKQAVSKAVKAGRVTLIDGQIDPEIADREWARNTDPEQQERGAPEQFEITQARVQASAHEAEPPVVREDNPLLIDAKARTEKLRADLLEIEIREKRGELIVANDARRVQFNLARSTRNAILAVPARLAPLLAPIADAAEIERVLEAELRKICQQLATTPAVEQ